MYPALNRMSDIGCICHIQYICSSLVSIGIFLYTVDRFGLTIFIYFIKKALEKNFSKSKSARHYIILIPPHDQIVPLHVII